ncbi:MAG: S8 family serine peptidase [candidate division WOR-3 bacterium]
MTAITLLLTALPERLAPSPVPWDKVEERKLALTSEMITLDTAYALRNLGNPDYWRDAVPGRFIVRYQHGADPLAIAADLSVFGAKVVKRSKTGADFVVVEINDPSVETGADFIRTAYAHPDILWTEPLFRARAFFTPNDPYWTDQWGPYVMYMDLAWDQSRGSKTVVVGVVDQGVDYNHPDLAANFGSSKGYDFVDEDSDPFPDNPYEETHGTHVSGTVAGVLNNGVGVCGMANITLLSARVLDESGSGTYDDVTDGIRWCAQQGVRVISMSLGGSSGSATLEEAINYAYDTMGVLIVAAAGNDGMGEVSYPATYAACIAVGALDTTGDRAWFSNYGYALDVMAPGVGIISTVPMSSYDIYDGTSMATPHVSGLSALLFSVNSSLTNKDARTILEGTCVDMGDAGWDMFTGYGLVDGHAAVIVAQSWGPANLIPDKIILKQNPARGTARFIIPFPEPGFSLSIYDISGRLMDRVPVRQMMASWTAPGAGVYFATFGTRMVSFIVE